MLVIALLMLLSIIGDVIIYLLYTNPRVGSIVLGIKIVLSVIIFVIVIIAFISDKNTPDEQKHER